MSAAAKQASVDGRLSRPKSPCGLLVGKTEQIDGHDHVAICAGRGCDRGDHTTRLDSCKNVERSGWIRDVHRDDRGSSRGDPAERGVRVTERPEEVRQIILTTQHPWARKDTRKRLLDEILGLVVRRAQGPRDSVQNGPMGYQGPRVEEARFVRIADQVASGRDCREPILVLIDARRHERSGRLRGGRRCLPDQSRIDVAGPFLTVERRVVRRKRSWAVVLGRLAPPLVRELDRGALFPPLDVQVDQRIA
jgi:hypothetical protein